MLSDCQLSTSLLLRGENYLKTPVLILHYLLNPAWWCMCWLLRQIFLSRCDSSQALDNFSEISLTSSKPSLRKQKCHPNYSRKVIVVKKKMVWTLIWQCPLRISLASENKPMQISFRRFVHDACIHEVHKTESHQWTKKGHRRHASGKRIYKKSTK